MQYFIISTLLLVGLTTARQILPLCSENEEFLNCGTACPKTCSTLTQDASQAQPTKCVEKCISGCFCKEGFVRDESRDNRCVPEEKCVSSYEVPKCAKNEVYAKCGPYCPLTCKGFEVKACPDVCVQGCVCQEGYVRSSEGGSCVPIATCDLYRKV